MKKGCYVSFEAPECSLCSRPATTVVVGLVGQCRIMLGEGRTAIHVSHTHNARILMSAPKTYLSFLCFIHVFPVHRHGHHHLNTQTTSCLVKHTSVGPARGKIRLTGRAKGVDG